MRNYLYLFCLLLGVWLCLSSSLHTQEVIAGLIVSFIISVLFGRWYARLGLPPMSIKRAWYVLLYGIKLALEIIKANFDVAYRVLHPALPIKPGIVAVKTNLKSDIAKFILANSITLTPGTFTVDVIGDRLLIHWIYVESEKLEDATQRISEKFEKYLRVIFE
ncbi:MAG: Na+/H+ antiporter subunit E [Chitinispirillaceae bacterium]|nr:Na+/H+ antiporter subunit E [Chitinispirillaceae bacterium]